MRGWLRQYAGAYGRSVCERGPKTDEQIRKGLPTKDVNWLTEDERTARQIGDMDAFKEARETAIRSEG